MTKKITIAFLLVALFLVSCEKEAKLNVDMEETFYLRNGNADMPVFIRGNGTSKVFVLLLHGGPGDGGLQYANHPFSNSLEEDYVMVYWDQRHQGNSHGHLKEEDITIENMVEDTYALTKVLKKRYGDDISLFLMGHSWGGMLGTSFMVKDDYQTTIKGWIESGGAHDFPLMNIELVKKIQEVAPMEISSGRNTADWQEMLDYVNTIDTNNIDLDQASKLNEFAGEAEMLIETLNEKSESDLSGMQGIFLSPNNPLIGSLSDAQLPESLYDKIIATSLTDELDKITTPTILLWGKYDFKVPLAVGQRALGKINTVHKSLKIYEHAGHSSMRYQSEDFVRDVKEFIESYK